MLQGHSPPRGHSDHVAHPSWVTTLLWGEVLLKQGPLGCFMPCNESCINGHRGDSPVTFLVLSRLPLWSSEDLVHH